MMIGTARGKSGQGRGRTPGQIGVALCRLKRAMGKAARGVADKVEIDSPCAKPLIGQSARQAVLDRCRSGLLVPG